MKQCPKSPSHCGCFTAYADNVSASRIKLKRLTRKFSSIATLAKGENGVTKGDAADADARCRDAACSTATSH